MARTDWDVFISFKHSGADGRPTRDAELARLLYDHLTARGLRVFLSSASLQQLGVAGYKKVIDEALESAGTLLAVGTCREHFESDWVRYEWDSFHNDMLSGAKPDGRLFVYVEGLSPRDLPRPLRQSQVFEHGPEASERLFRFIPDRGTQCPRGER